MNFLKLPVMALMLLCISACGSEPTTPEEIGNECAELERNERERCLQYHMGSYEQQRRKELEEQE
jgi:hypothetical protein